MDQVAKTFTAVDLGDGTDGRWAARVAQTMAGQDAAGWLTEEGRTARGAAQATGPP